MDNSKRRSKVYPSEHYGDCWLSYKLMGKLKNNLTSYLKKTPEHKITRRNELMRKIALLSNIRSDMNIYMRDL